MGSFIKGVDFLYQSEIKSIQNMVNELQPFYEVFTNVRKFFDGVDDDQKYIRHSLYHKRLIDEALEFEPFIVDDNGTDPNRNRIHRNPRQGNVRHLGRQ